MRAGPYLLLAGVPGLEPRMAEPESEVLPLHHTPRCQNGEKNFIIKGV